MDTRQPSAALFFPPFCETALNGPHLGVHQLVAYLRREGIACRSYDLNVRFFRWLAEPDGKLDRLAAKRCDEFVELQGDRKTAPRSAEALRAIVSSLAYAPTALLQEKLGPHVLSAGSSGSTPREDTDPAGAHWWTGPMGSLFHYFEQLHPRTNGTVSSACDAVSKHEINLFDEFYSDRRTDAILEEATRADVVGINVSFGIQLEAALRLAQTIRRRDARSFIVLGGTQICLLDDADVARLARLPFVDGLILYEGEIPLAALCQAVAHDLPLADVPNLVRALPDGTVLKRASAKPIHPNDLPAPEFDDEELGLYRDLALPVYVTRGCYWGKCTFCDYVKLYTPGQPRVLARDAEKVVEDIKLLQSKHRVFRFRLITEAIPPKWCREFSRAIIANRVRASFWTYLKNEPKEVLTQELFELMKRAGIDDVTCGVESISDRVLAVIVKGTTVEDITDNFEMMRRADIRAVFNVIPDYPTTTHDEALAGLEYIARNKDLIQSLNFQMFDLSIKSSIAGCPESYGLVLPSKTTFVESPHGAHSLRFRRKVGLTSAQHRQLRAAYERLRRDIAVYHATVRNRERIAARGFDWRRATFSFRKLTAVSAGFSLVPKLRRSRTWLVLLPSLATYIEFPRRMEPFLAIIDAARRKPIRYAELLAAYWKSFAGSESDCARQRAIERSFRNAMASLVETGFVEDVVGGPRFTPDGAVAQLLRASGRRRSPTARRTSGSREAPAAASRPGRG